MAYHLRRCVAEQLAESILGATKSSPENIDKLGWCLRCTSTTIQKLPVHNFALSFRNLMASGFMPASSFDDQRKWCENLASQVKPSNLLLNIAPKNNVFLVEVSGDHFRKEVLENVYRSQEKYGTSSVVHEFSEISPGSGVERQPQRQNVLVEYSSPNIAKPFHAGHLRSTIIGNFIANIYQALNHKPMRLNYLGDWGTQFGLLGVGYQKYGSDTAMASNAMDHLFDVYVKINSEANGPNGEEVKSEARNFFRRLEDGDQGAKALWQYCRDRSISEYNQVYERLGVKFDHYEGESQYQEQTRSLIEQLRSRGLLHYYGEPPMGYVDLSTPNKPKVHANVLKNDGTSLYLTRDIAAALDRIERYQIDKIHYVVENGQHQHFEHLLGVLKKLDCDLANRCEDGWHIKFGRVIGMSTRRGNVVFLNDILDEAQSRMLTNMKESKTTKITENVDKTADRLGVSAVIVQDLKERRMKNYKFSWENSLKFTGDTGVSLQYAHARLCSLERLCGFVLDPACDTSLLTELSAALLIQHIAKFDECLQDSYKTLESSPLTNYLFRLCHLTNGALLELRVKDQPQEIAQARLMLFTCARICLANGLRILGIEPLEKM